MRNQHFSEAKNLIYPEQKKVDQSVLNKNLEEVRKIEQENKEKRIEEEKSLLSKPEPYKLKKFESIPSKVAQIINSKDKSEENKVVYDNEFVMSLIKENLDLKTKIREFSGPESSHNIQRVAEQDERDKISPVKSVSKPKKTNYLKINRDIVTQMEKGRFCEDPEKSKSVLHKEFGKVPKYIENFKTEKENNKKKEQLKKEENNYPKGTKLLSEEERVSTLSKLQETKSALLSQLDKLPISLRSLNLKNRKIEIDNKLKEVETAISTFSRKRVFVKA